MLFLFMQQGVQSWFDEHGLTIRSALSLLFSQNRMLSMLSSISKAIGSHIEPCLESREVSKQLEFHVWSINFGIVNKFRIFMMQLLVFRRPKVWSFAANCIVELVENLLIVVLFCYIFLLVHIRDAQFHGY